MTEREFIRTNQDQIVSELMDFVSVPANQGPAKPGMPYGEEPANSLAWAKAYVENSGLGFTLRAESEGEYALYTLGKPGKELGLFCHVDVVTKNGDWQFTEPFNPVIRNGYIVGRGVKDDKGSVIACVNALKALKAAGKELKSNVVIFLGANEETGFADIDHYIAKYGSPDFSLAVDTDLPVCRGEKSFAGVSAKCGRKFETIIDFTGGEQPGTVCGKLIARMPYSEGLEAELKAACEGKTAEYAKDGDQLVLTAFGIPHHGSNPKGTVNAGAVACEVLMNCPSVGANDISILEETYPLLSTYFGEPYGIDLPDRSFGRFTTCCGKIVTEDGYLHLAGWFLCLAPKYSFAEGVYPKMEAKFKEMGWSFNVTSEFNGYEMPADAPEVQILNNEYLKIVGEQLTPIYVSRGMTYASRMERCLAIGVDAPKFEAPEDYLPGHGKVHCPDESLQIDAYMTGIEVVAADIAALCEHLAK